MTVGDLWALLASEDPERVVLVDIGRPPVDRHSGPRNTHPIQGVDRDAFVPLLLEL